MNSSDVLAMMWDATYTLCPAGDAPDSPRVYSALAHGSIPLVDPATSLPPLANWSDFSWPIRIDSAGVLVLPTAQQEAMLLRSAWRHRRAFDCEASNPAFTGYIERSLAIIAAAHRNQPEQPSHTLATRRTGNS